MQMKKVGWILGFACRVFVLFAWCNAAAPTPQYALAEQPLVLPQSSDSPLASPFQRANTASPRDTLKSFLAATNAIYAEIQSGGYLDLDLPAHRSLVRATVDCLDMSQVPAFAREERSGEVAVCLKEILDRVEIPDWNEIPGTEEISSAEDPKEFDRWQIPGARITITRVSEGDRRHEYLFSAGTVDRAVPYYEDARYLPYRTTPPEVSRGFHRWYFAAPGNAQVAAVVNRLPEWMKSRRLAGVIFWKWPGILSSMAIAVLAMYAAYRLQRVLVKRTRRESLFGYGLTALLPMVAILIPLIFKQFLSSFLDVRGTPLYYLSFGADVTAILAGIVVAFAVGNRIAELIIASPQIHPQGLDAQLIRIIGKLMGLVWYSPPDYWQYLAFCERLNLEVFRAFEEADIQFSLPFRIRQTNSDSTRS